jgi:phage-related protein
MPRSHSSPGLSHFRRVHVNVNLAMRDVAFYVTASGRCPVLDFIEGLPTKSGEKILRVVDLVRQLDVVPPQYLKKLAGTGDLWEVRAQYGGRAFRLLGFFQSGRLVVLVSGFVKKTEEVPAHEIALAQWRRRDYWERNRRNG